MLYPTLFTWVYFVALQEHSTVLQQLAYALGKGLQFGFPVVWVYRFARRPWPPLWADPSFTATSGVFSPRGGVIAGVSFGLVVAIAIVGLYHLLPADAVWFVQARRAIQGKVTDLGISSAGKFLALGLFYSLVHSAAEEYYWRWFVFRGLTAIVTRPQALVLSSLGFMAHHVILLGTFTGYAHPATWLGSAAVAVGGFCWAWLYDRSGRLFGPWLSHLLVDAALFYVGYLIARDTFR